MTTPARLLVVEDDPGLQTQLRWTFQGYDLVVAADRASALAAVRAHAPAVVTLDLGLPPDPANASEGLKTLTEILRIAPATRVIVVTGNDEREVAQHAVAAGACDYCEKPIDPDELQRLVARACRLYALETEYAQANAAPTPGLGGFIGQAANLREVARRIARIAPTDATVLLLGESGTGKELLARAVHDLSPRAGGNFVAINCAAIPENLLESELFGHERGAFTGAVRQTRGKLEYAHGGTLFLDEMGDLPFSLQAKLLRFLQERVLERVGGRSQIAVDTRIVCATHRPLPALIEQGAFREDLYYRISEMTVQIPPLRERPGDAIVIARHLLARYRNGLQAAPRDFSPAALAAIEAWPWPGNVRELENRVKRAVILAEGKLIEPGDLDLEPPAVDTLRTLRAARDEAEGVAVQQALAAAGGQIVKAAEVLGVSRPTVYHLIRKFGLED